jgi:nucleoid-associated protein YgaU
MATVVTGCISMSKPSPKTAATENREPAKLAQLWMQQGQELVQKGDFVGAQKKYKLVRTISPQNQDALQKLQWLEREISRAAEKHYKAGLKAKKRGQYAKARRQFLMTLRMKPNHKKAKEMLTTHARVEAKQYIVHTLKPGESLSSVAKIYYGDYKKFPLIAAFNELEDASKLTVGQKIKVPQNKDTPFLISPQAVKTEKKKQEVLKDEWCR